MANPYDDVFNAVVSGGNLPGNPYDEAWSNSMPKEKKKQERATAEPVTDFSGNLRIGPVDTGIPLPQFMNRSLAQFGSGVADLGQGIKQRTGNATELDTLEKRRLDANLNTDVNGKIVSTLGKAFPALAFPFSSAYPVASGMFAGGATGFLEPTAPGDSVFFNTAMGTTLGGAVPALGAAYKAAVNSGKNADLARTAIEKYGIPVSVPDVTDNRFIKGIRSVLNDLPFTGSIGAAQNNAKQEGFNAAVGRTFGANSTSLTPDVVYAAKKEIGNKLNTVWDNNNLVLDGQFISDLNNISNKAKSLLPEQAAQVERQVQNLLQQAQNGQVSGSFVNNWQSELRQLVDGEKGFHKTVLNDLRKSTLGAFNRSVTGDDAAKLLEARRQYGAYKTVEPILNKAEAGVAGRVSGDVPAALLPQRVVSNYGSAAGTPFEDLAPIAGRLMTDRTPQTGGSVRALIQNAGVGAAAAGAGAYVNAPITAGLLSGGMAAQYGMGPEMARRLLQQASPRGLLSKPDVMAALKEIAATGASRSPIPIGMGLLSLPSLEQ